MTTSGNQDPTALQALAVRSSLGFYTYSFSDNKLNVRIQERRTLKADLRQALAAGELELHYQPIVNLEQSKLVSAEALVRWRKPDLGLILPADFIPLAEETGLIVPLGEWVLKQACAVAVNWPDSMRVAVNVSALQLKKPGFKQAVVGALAASGLSASRLELEITESALLDDNEAMLDTLCELRGFGVRIALDDFGTGYSSLGHLHSIPLDKLKIDRAFIKRSAGKNNSKDIIRAIVTLARSFGITTTAEGIESKQQLDVVRGEGGSVGP